MPDLDEMLVADARWSHDADGAPSDFGPAFERALGVARRRRTRTVGVSAAAAAVVATSSLFALNANSPDQPAPHVRLAAYDRVLGPVPNDDGSVYVVGPKDEHTAGCAVVPDMPVTREWATGDPAASPHAITIRIPPGVVSSRPDITQITGVLGDEDLYVFVCPID